MNFHIGMDVVCIESTCDLLKEGEIYTIKGLRESPCKCGGVDMYVGIIDKDYLGDGLDFIECTCGFIEKMQDAKSWYHESQFKPLDELCNISEITEVLEKSAFS